MVSQSACVTPSGLSIEILKNLFLPPPFNSTSTISIPSDCATPSAMASILETIAALMFPPNKKVGFRPLQEFDTYNSIVACPEENATFGGKLRLHRSAASADFYQQSEFATTGPAGKPRMHVRNFHILLLRGMGLAFLDRACMCGSSSLPIKN